MRPFALADADELLAVFSDAAVRRYLLDDAEVSRNWVLLEIAASGRQFAEGGAGLWSVRLAHSPDIVGFAGFRESTGAPRLQLLYGLLPECWGRGIALEVTTRICDHVFLELGFDEIAATTDRANGDSAKLLRRLGMRLVATDVGGATGTALFAVDRGQWLGMREEASE